MLTSIPTWSLPHVNTHTSSHLTSSTLYYTMMLLVSQKVSSQGLRRCF